jgi:formylglycine-generating enzyme required for sulfatase activity
MLEQIRNVEARPPRQWDDTIPRELERICLKCLSKRATERYTTARDLAEDLRHFQAGQQVGPLPTTLEQPPVAVPGTAANSPLSPPGGGVGGEGQDTPPVKVIPKGLRSFDARDADFFLDLLPGPRDREGLPDSIRFWKARIEETDPDNTFAVGLLYGPSGCGKSSLVKAGLLPRLSDHVLTVYVEATAGETEARLLNGLRKRCPGLPGNLDLGGALAAVRRGAGQGWQPAGKKVLLVLDQFEQWLHARQEESGDLVPALRQCDGVRVQCLVMVRDDFWMATTRFMHDLEIRLVEGQNSQAVDLFPLRHAEKVLAAFGRAFGTLPADSHQADKDQQQFLALAARGLAQEDKVVCVRLALFAEMMKGKPWTPGSLKAVGGAEGVGATFLEETFSAAGAPPEHRYHQRAARALLRALLPEAGADIKGHMRSHAALLEVSGYAKRPREFDELVRILDSEVRLITPTDPPATESASPSPPTPLPGGERGEEDPSPPTPLPGGERGDQGSARCYQLTHDYLVPSLREWLTRKQKETRRGRAELLLADRAAVWQARPENRQLPSLGQWCGIRWWTRKKNWTPPERRMMRQATRYHGLRGLLAACVLAVLTWTGLAISDYVAEQERQAQEKQRANHAAGLVQQLVRADIAKVPKIVEELAAYRAWADPLLKDQHARAAADSPQQLRTSLALLPVDPGQVGYLYGRLLGAEPQEVAVLRDALAPHQAVLRDKLWRVATQPAPGKPWQRLRAAAALATYDPDSPRWEECQAQVAADLVAINPVYLEPWSDCFRPVKGRLLEALSVHFRDPRPERATERILAATLLADYARNEAALLVDLLMDADARQFTIILPKVQAHGQAGRVVLEGEVDRPLTAEAGEDAKEKLAKRQARAAVALLKLKHADKVWPLLKHNSDPRVRSYLIHLMGPLGVDAGMLVKRLTEEPEVDIRRALLLSLGPDEFGEAASTAEEKKALVQQVQELYRTADDAGLHAAAEWLLRQWQLHAWLTETTAAWARDKEQRAQRLEGIKQALAKHKEKAPPQWYVNSQGQTLVVLAGPIEFTIGSPISEAGREGGADGQNERQVKKQINRTLVIAAKEVTVAQFLAFRPQHSYTKHYVRSLDCPVNNVTWYDAAAYCNWLSEQEGLEPCYEPKAQGQYAAGMKLKASYLSLPGYRLPTEAEWEYACRAGTATSRYHGESEEILGKYAWYANNSLNRWLLPVGSLKPNDWGLFDMLGNALEWCQDIPYLYSSGEDRENTKDTKSISSADIRVLRGGSFGNPALLVRSAGRSGDAPTDRGSNLGFRPARTFC